MIFAKPLTPSSQMLAAYLEGELTASETREVERELAASREAQTRLQKLREIRDTLARHDEDLESIDLTGRVRRAIESDVPAATMWPRWTTWGMCAAAALGALLVILTPPKRGEDHLASEFRSKAAGPVTGTAGESEIRIYRARENAPPEPLLSEVSRNDGLLVSYANAYYQYLMVFAVDAANETHWLQPVYDRQGTDPVSIPIGVESKQRLIPIVVRHDFASGPLRMYALFSQRACRVSELGAWLSTQRFRPERPPQIDAFLQRLDLVVQP